MLERGTPEAAKASTLRPFGKAFYLGQVPTCCVVCRGRYVPLEHRERGWVGDPGRNSRYRAWRGWRRLRLMRLMRDCSGSCVRGGAYAGEEAYANSKVFAQALP